MRARNREGRGEHGGQDENWEQEEDKMKKAKNVGNRD